MYLIGVDLVDKEKKKKTAWNHWNHTQEVSRNEMHTRDQEPISHRNWFKGEDRQE
jgi:hypothetical protein